MRYQAKAAQQCFAFGYCVITHVGMRVTADKGAQLARPDIVAGQLTGQINTEVQFQPIPVENRFVVGAHIEDLLR